MREFVAATPQAYGKLWRLLFVVDLTRSIRYSVAAPDEGANC